MARTDATTIAFERVEFMGQPVLFTDWRIDRSTIPDGLHLYEVRHTDDDWGAPCQLGHRIVVNFYGSIVSNQPIQLPPDGLLDFNGRDFQYSYDGQTQRLTDYMAAHPPVDSDIMQLFVATPEEHALFFSDEKQDKASGCVGHLRGDFGSGTEFYTTWWPHQNDTLNTPDFKKDIDRVVNWLRKDYAPLKDLSVMRGFCARYGSQSEIPGAMTPSHGFRIETKQFQYMLRCAPQKGDYNFYLYCYAKAAREQEHAIASKQPKQKKKKRPEPER